MQIESITQTLLDRLTDDLNNGQRSNNKIKSHPVWDFTRDNVPRIIAWKVLKNQIKLEHDLDEDPDGCLLQDADDFECVDRTDDDGGSTLCGTN